MTRKWDNLRFVETGEGIKWLCVTKFVFYLECRNVRRYLRSISPLVHWNSQWVRSQYHCNHISSWLTLSICSSLLGSASSLPACFDILHPTGIILLCTHPFVPLLSLLFTHSLQSLSFSIITLSPIYLHNFSSACFSKALTTTS